MVAPLVGAAALAAARLIAKKAAQEAAKKAAAKAVAKAAAKKAAKKTKQQQLENKQSKSFVNQYSKDAKKKGVGAPGLIDAAPKSVANFVGPKVPVKKI